MFAQAQCFGILSSNPQPCKQIVSPWGYLTSGGMCDRIMLGQFVEWVARQRFHLRSHSSDMERCSLANSHSE